MNKGWIKLHRQLLDNSIIKKPYYNHLWIVLLLKATHSPSEFIWNNKKCVLLPGQILTGRKQLSDESGIKGSTIERILKFLENEQQIEQQKTPKFRIITIKRWQFYQQAEQQDGQQMDNKRTTNGQQMDTYKNDKNGKNVKKIYRSGEKPNDRSKIYRMDTKYRSAEHDPNCIEI